MMLEEIKRLCAPIFSSRPVARAYVFGSYARGDEVATSDVDLSYDCLPGHTIGGLAAFSELRNELSSALGTKVDLFESPTQSTCYTRASRIFLEEYLNERKLVYER